MFVQVNTILHGSPVMPTWKPIVLSENEKLEMLTPIFIH